MDPFKTDQDIIEVNLVQKIQRIRTGGYHGLKSIPISDEAVAAMLAMLEKDPSRRISIEDILKLPIFTQ